MNVSLSYFQFYKTVDVLFNFMEWHGYKYDKVH